MNISSGCHLSVKLQSAVQAKKAAFAGSDINILITPDQTGKHTISSEAFARMILTMPWRIFKNQLFYWIFSG